MSLKYVAAIINQTSLESQISQTNEKNENLSNEVLRTWHEFPFFSDRFN
jgi:hypothetical protein